MFKFALVTILIIAVKGTPETHHFIQVNNGIEIPQDIVYDPDEQTVLVTVAAVPQLECGIPTINFHDYRTGYVAFKDVNASRCYLTHPPIPHPTPEIYRMKKTTLSLQSRATVSNEVMSPNMVKEMAGERIQQFCADYDTYWMHLKYEGRTKRASGGDCILCLICFIRKEETDAEQKYDLTDISAQRQLESIDYIPQP